MGVLLHDILKLSLSSPSHDELEQLKVKVKLQSKVSNQGSSWKTKERDTH